MKCGNLQRCINDIVLHFMEVGGLKVWMQQDLGKDSVNLYHFVALKCLKGS